MMDNPVLLTFGVSESVRDVDRVVDAEADDDDDAHADDGVDGEAPEVRDALQGCGAVCSIDTWAKIKGAPRKSVLSKYTCAGYLLHQLNMSVWRGCVQMFLLHEWAVWRSSVAEPLGQEMDANRHYRW